MGLSSASCTDSCWCLFTDVAKHIQIGIAARGVVHFNGGFFRPVLSKVVLAHGRLTLLILVDFLAKRRVFVVALGLSILGASSLFIGLLPVLRLKLFLSVLRLLLLVGLTAIVNISLLHAKFLHFVRLIIRVLLRGFSLELFFLAIADPDAPLTAATWLMVNLDRGSIAFRVVELVHLLLTSLTYVSAVTLVLRC